jgi:hypothetical protein
MMRRLVTLNSEKYGKCSMLEIRLRRCVAEAALDALLFNVAIADSLGVPPRVSTASAVVELRTALAPSLFLPPDHVVSVVASRSAHLLALQALFTEAVTRGSLTLRDWHKEYVLQFGMSVIRRDLR